MTTEAAAPVAAPTAPSISATSAAAADAASPTSRRLELSKLTAKVSPLPSPTWKVIDLSFGAAAVESVNTQQVIFVKDYHGFEPVPIRIGKNNSESIEILSGLSNGQEYVKRGGFVLKAQLAKGSFSGGHNH